MTELVDITTQAEAVRHTTVGLLDDMFARSRRTSAPYVDSWPTAPWHDMVTSSVPFNRIASVITCNPRFTFVTVCASRR
jgi:hypothetical protein